MAEVHLEEGMVWSPKKWVEDGTLSEGRGEGERRTYGDSAIRRELREFAGEK